jgi:hypothetical protein
VGGSPGEGNCFELVGKGLRCEGAEAHAQGPNFERVAAATNLAECEDACLARADCVGVSDYFQEPDLPLCYLTYTECGTAGMGDWQEEDAGKEYRKVCPAGEPCHLEYLGDWIRCESTAGGDTKAIESSAQDCRATCLAEPACAGIIDYFYLSDVPGCYLYTASCAYAERLPAEDSGKSYVRQPCR